MGILLERIAQKIADEADQVVVIAAGPSRIDGGIVFIDQDNRSFFVIAMQVFTQVS